MRLAVWLLLLGLAQPALAYYPMEMWQAERKAAAGQWAEAAQLYREALKSQPDSPEALYNLGVCHYRQGQFDKAEPLFKKALELASPGKLKGQAAYNLGNCLFHQKKLKESLDPYKVALRWNELDDDARYNIQVVLDMLKEPPPKDQDKDKKDDKKKDQNKDKDKNKDKNKDKDKDKDKDKKQPPKGSPTPTPSPGGGSPSPTPTPKPPQPQPSSPEQREKEDAERLLQFFQNREKQAQKRKFPARPASPTGDLDW